MHLDPALLSHCSAPKQSSSVIGGLRIVVTSGGRGFKLLQSPPTVTALRSGWVNVEWTRRWEDAAPTLGSRTAGRTPPPPPAPPPPPRLLLLLLLERFRLHTEPRSRCRCSPPSRARSPVLLLLLLLLLLLCVASEGSRPDLLPP
ncbi:hypothetical protein INR49_006746 [Caranx melampygus]|nr:hypothetical protein INR49_006746 [Caranx melampygus]